MLCSYCKLALSIGMSIICGYVMFQSRLGLVLCRMNTYADGEQMIDSSVMLFATCDVIYIYEPKEQRIVCQPGMFPGLSVCYLPVVSVLIVRAKIKST
jgi:hypothetical protein